MDYEDMIILIDTREQKPYIFGERYKTQTQTMKTGDYSIHGAEQEIVIERKSLSDFLGCTTGKNRDRFKRELERGMKIKHFYVIIESSLNDIMAGKYRKKIHPNAVIGSIKSWTTKFGVNFIYADNRRNGKEITLRLLKTYYKEKQNASIEKKQ